MTSRIAPLLCLLLAACGTGGAPSDGDAPDEAREETVFDDLVEQKEAIPAEIEAAQQRRADETRRALDEAEGGSAREGESSR